MGFHRLHLAVMFVFSLLTFAMSCRQITFQFIATFVTLVPLVDCSSVLHERTDLSEVKHLHTVDLLPLSWFTAWLCLLKTLAESRFTASWCLSFRWRERCARPQPSLRTLCFSSWTGALKCDLAAFIAVIKWFNAHHRTESLCVFCPVPTSGVLPWLTAALWNKRERKQKLRKWLT